MNEGLQVAVFVRVMWHFHDKSGCVTFKPDWSRKLATLENLFSMLRETRAHQNFITSSVPRNLECKSISIVYTVIVLHQTKVIVTYLKM